MERGSRHGYIRQNGTPERVWNKDGAGPFRTEGMRTEDAVQPEQGKIHGLCGAVSGPFEFETILKVLVEFYKDGGLRRRIKVPRQNDGQFPSLDSHFPESVEQVLDLFAVDKPEGMEVFPTGGGVQVK
ncbi:hypothetical protein HMPREF3038_03067, partial [Akkermansia sp. KLE1797]